MLVYQSVFYTIFLECSIDFLVLAQYVNAGARLATSSTRSSSSY